MNSLYTHGKIDCAICHNSELESFKGLWNLVNNPFYWGSSSPEILVLGYSKGATQMKEENFEDIAFKGMRDRLKEILVLLQLIDKEENINTMFQANEKRFGFASLIRCGIIHNGLTSGPLINKSFKEKYPKQVIENCTIKFLKNNIPKSVKKILLLGSAIDYKKLSMKHFSMIFDDFKKINDDTFFANGIEWIYVAHPSPANGHFKKWTENYK